MEEEQEQKRNGRRRAGKLMPKSALCKFLHNADFGINLRSRCAGINKICILGVLLP